MLQKEGNELIVISARGGIVEEMKDVAMEKFKEEGISFNKCYWKQDDKLEVDFYISSEAGITNLLGEWIDINCALIEDKNGVQSIGTSQGFPIPEKYIEEIKETELGKVMDKIFSGKDLGKGKGGISYLTKNEVSRIDLTKNVFIMALTKHINGDIWR